MIAKSVLIRP